MTKTWSTQALEAAANVREAIFRHPFITELGSGTLPRHKFLFYLRQDTLYLDSYRRVLARIASLLPDKTDSASFLGFASGCIAVESAMHSSFLGSEGSGAAMKSPACELYTSMLLGLAGEPVEVQAAATLPCFVVYLETGRHIAAHSVPDNPYARWIATYDDASFAESCRLATEICNRMAARVTDEVRRRMTEVFVLATRLEWMFWNSAYNTETWPI